MNILDKIVADKRIEVQRHKEAYTVDMLLGSEQMMRSTVSLSRALSESSSGIIAEFKRRSPSKGWIHRDADVERVVLDYQRGGASASSILTDYTYFGGTVADLCKVRKSIDIPLLRKNAGTTERDGRNDAKRLCTNVVTVSDEVKPKKRKMQGKAEYSRRTVCKSLPKKM